MAPQHCPVISTSLDESHPPLKGGHIHRVEEFFKVLLPPLNNPLSRGQCFTTLAVNSLGNVPPIPPKATNGLRLSSSHSPWSFQTPPKPRFSLQ